MRIAGGCLCGAVRFEGNAEPQFQVKCYCNDCRKTSGAGRTAMMGFQDGAIGFEGEAREFCSIADNGNDVTRVLPDLRPRGLCPQRRYAVSACACRTRTARGVCDRGWSGRNTHRQGRTGGRRRDRSAVRCAPSNPRQKSAARRSRGKPASQDRGKRAHLAQAAISIRSDDRQSLIHNRGVSPRSQNNPAMMSKASAVTDRRMCSSGAC